jgi:transposase InsO family protein
VKKIRSDNGSEFKNLQVEEYLEEEGIKHEFSAPYTPQQNGVVERKNRTLLNMARTMLGEFKTPERFWSEAVNTACTTGIHLIPVGQKPTGISLNRRELLIPVGFQPPGVPCRG